MTRLPVIPKIYNRSKPCALGHSVSLRPIAAAFIISAPLLSAALLTGCAGAQYNPNARLAHTQIISGHRTAAPNNLRKSKPLKPYKRYGFVEHNLDMTSSYVADRKTVKIANAGTVSPVPRATLSNKHQSTIGYGANSSRPQLRRRVRFQLDAYRPDLSKRAEQPHSAPKPQALPVSAEPAYARSIAPAPESTAIAPQTSAPQTSAGGIAIPATATARQSEANAFTIQNKPSTAELSRRVNQSSTLQTYETAKSQAKRRSRDLSVPALPEEQRRVVLQEQAALARLKNKTVLAGSESLQKSLDSAFERSSRLASENLRIDEAEEVLTQAKAQSKPRVEFRGAVGPRESETSFAFDNTTISATTVRRSAELDLTLPIYQGGRLRAQRSSAKVGIETARAAVSQTRSDIIEQTALAYLDVVRDRKLVALYQDNIDLLRHQQDSVSELISQGESTIGDKAVLDARVASQLIRLEAGFGDLNDSEARYKNLTGKPAALNLPVPRFDLPLSLTEIQALSQQNSPEITSLISRAKSAEYDVDIAKSGGKPSLSLQGILRGAEGQSETIDRNTAAELLLNLRVPISSGGENRSRVRQAKIARNRMNLEIRDAQDTLRDRVERLWSRKLSSEKSLTFNAQQIEATQLAVDTVDEQYRENVATILDLLNVQQTLLDARIQNIGAENLRDTSNIQLLNLMGIYR